MQQNKNAQFYQFDVLRALAIIGVFFVHCQYAIYPGFDFSYNKFFVNLPQQTERYKYMAMSPFAFGWAGVILFFLISGFLIHYSTLSRGIENFKLIQFFSRRFWRIYPPYLIALLFFTITTLNIKNVINHPKDFVAHVLLIHNFSDRYIFSINGVFWSLAVEVQLYLLYPLFLYVSIKTNVRSTLLILLLIGGLTTVYWWHTSSFSSIAVGNSVLRHWFAWGLGAYLGECFYYKKRLFDKVTNLSLCALCAVFYFSKIMLIHMAIDHYFVAVLLAVFMERYLYSDHKITVVEKILIPVGLCSYSIYLLHMPFLTLMYHKVDVFNLAAYNRLMFFLINSVPVFVIVFLISYVSYLFLEKGSIRLGNIINKKYFTGNKGKGLFKPKPLA